MGSRDLIKRVIGFLILIVSIKMYSQAPVANFSINTNPVCAGDQVQITDLSTGNPVSWTYSVIGGGPPATYTAQNPTLVFNTAGNRVITLLVSNGSGTSIPVSQTITVNALPNAQLNPMNSNSCLGANPVTINALTMGTTALTYNWSTGASTTSISVTPTVTTTYTCIITNSLGCSAARTATVTIGQPTLTIGASPSSICGGGSSTLSATESGPGPWTYAWSTSATTKTTSTSLTGVYTVTVTNANGCTAVQSYTLGNSTVLTLTATANPSVVCSGNNAVLIATGATNYTWSSGSFSTQTTVSPTITTTYTVEGQSSTCTGSTVITLTVNHTPTLNISGSPPSVCEGYSSSITVSGANTYSWSTGATTSVITVFPLSNTTYSVRGVNQGCQPRTATISIAVNPTPTIQVVAMSSVICAGENAIFAASGALTYSWNTGATTPIITENLIIPTSYTVTGTDSKGCAGTATISQSVQACDGLEKTETSLTRLTIYPNPSENEFHISATKDLQGIFLSQTEQLIKIISLDESNSRKISISGLPPGIYFIIGQNSGTFLREKIVVLK